LIFKYLILLLFSISFIATSYAEEGGGLSLEPVEKIAMERLAKIQEEAIYPEVAFSSDGCSGGLSAGWEALAENLPSFAKTLGEKPPWEECCVAHDRLYWAGRTDDGYRRRLLADGELRACVMSVGRSEAPALSSRYDISVERIEEVFSIAAEAMFVAVRVGGVPCTGLPWRWGYAWPQCIDLDGDN